MARIVGGIGASHSPTIGYAKDTGKQFDPAWKPIFDGFAAIRTWVQARGVQVLFMIYNDHITSFFFDHYSAYALGIDDRYKPADEGGGPREGGPARGHLGLSHHIAMALVADEFDMSFFRGKPVDHGLLSPLSMLGDAQGPWPGQVVPLRVGVLQLPVPGAKACGSWAGPCAGPSRAIARTSTSPSWPRVASRIRSTASARASSTKPGMPSFLSCWSSMGPPQGRPTWGLFDLDAAFPWTRCRPVRVLPAPAAADRT